MIDPDDHIELIEKHKNEIEKYKKEVACWRETYMGCRQELDASEECAKNLQALVGALTVDRNTQTMFVMQLKAELDEMTKDRDKWKMTCSQCLAAETSWSDLSKAQANEIQYLREENKKLRTALDYLEEKVSGLDLNE